jgi:hypothetical protein
VATAAEIDALTDDPWVTGGEPEWEWLRDKEWAFIGSALVVQAVANLAPSDDPAAMFECCPRFDFLTARREAGNR